MPEQMIDLFGRHYEKGIDGFGGLPAFMDMLYGTDWEIVS
jgi:hypothetical protein